MSKTVIKAIPCEDARHYQVFPHSPNNPDGPCEWGVYVVHSNARLARGSASTRSEAEADAAKALKSL